jgi:response regulator of citrate/malate metabolism
MILNIRYFNEKSNEDYEEYIKLWEENKNRLIFFGNYLSKKQQINNIIENIKQNSNKDIIAIRYPPKNLINKNEIIQKILKGEGLEYNGIWYPKEIWIYNTI